MKIHPRTNFIAVFFIEVDLRVIINFRLPLENSYYFLNFLTILLITWSHLNFLKKKKKIIIQITIKTQINKFLNVKLIFFVSFHFCFSSSLCYKSSHQEIFCKNGCSTARFKICNQSVGFNKFVWIGVKTCVRCLGVSPTQLYAFISKSTHS